MKFALIAGKNCSLPTIPYAQFKKPKLQINFGEKADYVCFDGYGIEFTDSKNFTLQCFANGVLSKILKCVKGKCVHVQHDMHFNES